ncbi:hypothetical protein Tco_0262709 [Tanacetum coccineum]
MRDTIPQTRFENVSKLSNDLLLARGKTLQSGEDSLKLNELIEPSMVESSRDEESLDDADMFDVNTLTSDKVLAEQEVATKDVNLTVDEVTLA